MYYVLESAIFGFREGYLPWIFFMKSSIVICSVSVSYLIWSLAQLHLNALTLLHLLHFESMFRCIQL